MEKNKYFEKKKTEDYMSLDINVGTAFTYSEGH